MTWYIQGSRFGNLQSPLSILKTIILIYKFDTINMSITSVLYHLSSPSVRNIKISIIPPPHHHAHYHEPLFTTNLSPPYLFHIFSEHDCCLNLLNSFINFQQNVCLMFTWKWKYLLNIKYFYILNTSTLISWRLISKCLFHCV